MKKLVLAMLVFATNTYAANLTDNIGYECAKILQNLQDYEYPTIYNNIKPRNSQFWALEKCLKVYEATGGNIQELNKRVEAAYILSTYEKLQAIGADDKTLKLIDTLANITYRNTVLNSRDNIEYVSLSAYNDETKKIDKILVKDTLPQNTIDKMKEPITPPKTSWFRRLFR